MGRFLSDAIVEKIREFRRMGNSVPEISNQLGVGRGSVLKYIIGVEVDSRLAPYWRGKRGGSVRRMEEAWNKARIRAKTGVDDLDNSTKLLVLTSLYWAEGSKADFSFMNSDPEMVALFVRLIKEILRVKKDQIRSSIRIYSGMDELKVKDFWSKMLNIDLKMFGNTEIVKGNKRGKLIHGMCRIRVLKGGDLLKYLVAVRERIIAKISPHSSTDRAGVS